MWEFGTNQRWLCIEGLSDRRCLFYKMSYIYGISIHFMMPLSKDFARHDNTPRS
jgi:hypothetical protein